MSVLFMTALAAGPALAASVGYFAGRRPLLRQLADARCDLAAVRRAMRQDSLTGALNRLGVLDELATWTAGGTPFAVLLVDLDGFKAVNDKYGHTAGDVVLIDVAERLEALVDGVGGAVGRLGGDEFVLVAPAVAPVLGRLLGYDVARAVARPTDVNGRVITVRASVGVVQALPGDDVRALLRSADLAMYQAKAGRGQAGVAEFDAVLGLVGVVEERPGARLRELGRLGQDLGTLAEVAA
jgi:diguanylate cyclase (GGDEF)-like protein